MKLYRFIGENEFKKIIAGETLENKTDWRDIYDTNSIGFCFFQYNRTNNINKIINNVLDNWGFAGIVDNSFLIEIEIEKARKSWGFYPDGFKTEYNLTEYSIKNVKNIYKVEKDINYDYIGIKVF